jgi:hypothetical protein
MNEKDLEKLARAEYPRNRMAQLHFIEGFRAEIGDRAAERGLVGSRAEGAGSSAARQIIELRQRSPMRSTAQQHDESALALFTHADEPKLI